ncbi:MAG: hypothetical protein QXP88_00550 [Thermoproteota archaeon]
MLKVLKIATQSLFPQALSWGIVSVYPYPKDTYFVDNSQNVFLPTTLPVVRLNEWGVAEVQLIPNDLLHPDPNFYLVKILYRSTEYFYLIKITSDMPDVIDLKDVILNKQEKTICPKNGDKIFLEDVYV